MMDASDVMFLQDSIVWKIDEAPASMERVNRRPSVGNFIHIIEDCRKIRNLAHAKRVHMEIRDNGLEAHILLGSPLIQLYVECGSLPDAQQVFDSLVEHDEHSWTSLIHGYVETGKFQHALSLFNKMQEDHVDANRQTFLTLMKACSRLNWLDRGRKIHSEIAKEGFEIDPTIGNTLVDMYGKCNSVAEAREVFNDLTDRGLVSWNALISGYADNGLGEEALNCVDRMQLEGIVPDAITLLCGLKACASIGALERGLELHAMVAKEGFESHSFLSCTLVDMYAKCGQLADAREVFDELPTRSVVSWTVLIAGYAEHGHGEEALSCLAELQREGLSPNVITFVCSLKACGSIRAIVKGRELHAEIAKEGFESHPFLNSTLVDMYAKCGSLAESREVFNELPNQDLVSWTALIAGYAEHGHDEEALNSLEAMRRDGVSPNVVTLVCSLKACGNIGAIDRGRKLHIEIVIEGLETNSFAINALVGMYAKCGSLGEAWDVFEELPGRDVISWNAMILGYAEQGQSEKAFTLSAQMQEQGLLPDSTTFVSMLKAISNTEALETGKKIHAQVFRSSGLEATEVIFATAFIDMYSKCGSMANAQQVFDTIQTKDLILWTALITGYTQQGESNRVFHLFDTMTKAGVQPNSITFLSLLNVCSHSGLVDRAQKYIEVMSKEYGITPTIKHHNCMVDLLGRAGQFLQAVAVLEKMPTQPSYVTWSTVLGHCRNQDNVELAKHALESALRVDDKHHAMFDLMSNISADLFMEEYEDDDVL